MESMAMIPLLILILLFCVCLDCFALLGEDGEVEKGRVASSGVGQRDRGTEQRDA